MKFKNTQTNEIVEMTLDEILNEINRDRSVFWQDYDQSDWVDGLAFTEYTLEEQ